MIILPWLIVLSLLWSRYKINVLHGQTQEHSYIIDEYKHLQSRDICIKVNVVFVWAVSSQTVLNMLA